MRTYIYTQRERQALIDWLRGDLGRRSSKFLDNALTRTTRNRGTLRSDLHLLTMTLRKLSASNLRRRPDDFQTILAIAPISLRAVSEQAYISILPRLRRAEDIANDQSLPLGDRLIAAEEAVHLAKSMTHRKYSSAKKPSSK